MTSSTGELMPFLSDSTTIRKELPFLIRKQNFVPQFYSDLMLVGGMVAVVNSIGVRLDLARKRERESHKWRT